MSGRSLLESAASRNGIEVKYQSLNEIEPQVQDSVQAPRPQTWTDKVVHAIDSVFPYVRGKPLSYKFYENLIAGLSVSLVNLPLSISLALAAGGTPMQGVITAIYAGIVGALAGGSHFNIMGPTGALSGILLLYSVTYGIESLPLLSLGAGVVCIAVFLLGWDKYVTFLPSGVNIGFTFGVAIIIAANQIPAMFNLSGLASQPSFIANVAQNIKAAATEGDLRACAVCIMFWVPLFTLNLKYNGKPWLLLTVVLGCLLGIVSSAGWLGVAWKASLSTIKDKYGSLTLSLFNPAPTSSLWNDPTALLTGSLSIGFVAILETLISGKIADGITRTSMNQRRECMAVGLANIACGLAGGLPTTAALARTALNVKSGAQSRVAGVLGGLATIFIAFVALPFFEYLPMPVVAAMLIQVASGMIEFHGIIRLIRLDFVMLCHTIIVIVVCLVEDPTAGIVVGCLMGLVRFAQNVSSAFSRVFVLESHSSNSSNSNLPIRHSFSTEFLRGLSNSAHVGSADDQADESCMLGPELKACFAEPSPFPNADDDVTFPDRPVDNSPLTPALLGSMGHHVAVDPYTPSYLSVVVYRVIGKLAYINVPQHHSRIEQLKDISHLILSFRYCFYIDVDGIEFLEELLHDISNSKPKRHLYFASVNPMLSMLLKSSVYASLLQAGCVFSNHKTALHHVERLSNRALHGDHVTISEDDDDEAPVYENPVMTTI